MPPALQTLIARIGGPKRAMIAAVGLAAAVLIFGVSRWATAPEWVPAFQGLEMGTVGKMTDQLDQAGVQYRLEAGGTSILVAAPDLAKARVVLAREGLPSSGRPGMELFDQPSWGMTDFTQRINYRRALEGELERTIGKMRGIEAAQVHLAIHEASSFRRPTDKPSEASVVLKLRNGQEPASDVVTGISHLVASSVDGLEAPNVTIVDDAGRMLSDADDPTTMTGLSNQQLKVQREVENYLQHKAEQMVGQIVGPGNARVQVSAAVNFDRVERTTESVNPDQQAVSTEQKSEITPGAEGGAASTNVATSYDNTHSTESFSGAIGNLKRLTVAVLINEKQAAPVPGAKADAPPTFVARTPAELARIDTLVRSAVGLDSARGDVVSVISVPFDVPQVAAPEVSRTTQVLDTVQQVQRPALTVIGLLLVFAIALTAIRSLRTPETPALAAPATLAALGAGPAAASLGDGGVTAELSSGMPAVALPAPKPIALPVTPPPNPAREQVAATVEQYPDVAARLVRNWLKD